jgi:hypothetical protein
MCSLLKSRTTRKGCNISQLHYMILISEAKNEQALLMNVSWFKKNVKAQILEGDGG